MASAACSSSAELSTIIAFCPPVSAMNVASGASSSPIDSKWRWARLLLIARAVAVPPVKDDAVDKRAGGQRGADGLARAGQEMQHVLRHAGPVQKVDRGARDARRLLRRFRQYGVAGHQRRRDLAGENRQGEIPRADAGENAAPVYGQTVFLARHARQGARHHQAPCFGGVVAQEIHRLAVFAQRVADGALALLHDQRQQAVAPFNKKIGGALQRAGADGRPVRPAQPACALAATAIAASVCARVTS